MSCKWNINPTIPLFNKGQWSDSDDFKGIILLQKDKKRTKECFGKMVSRQMTVHHIIKKTIEYYVAAFICFVDLKKALVGESYLNTKLPINLISIKYTIKKTKIRQGNSLSSTLFNLIMNRLILGKKKIHVTERVIVRRKRCYAMWKMWYWLRITKVIYKHSFISLWKGKNIIRKSPRTIQRLMMSKELIRCKLNAEGCMIE